MYLMTLSYPILGWTHTFDVKTILKVKLKWNLCLIYIIAWAGPVRREVPDHASPFPGNPQVAIYLYPRYQVNRGYIVFCLFSLPEPLARGELL